jgi:hypothetical protein
MMIRTIFSLLLLAGLTAGCSGMHTAMTKVGRMGQNQGYEVSANLLVVQQATLEVLKAHGYETSVKADPESGAEAAGVIVIGQSSTKYDAKPSATGIAVETSKQMAVRDLVDIYLSKKWQLGSDKAAPDLTLVDIAGGSYLRKSPAADEVKTPLTKEFITLLRGEIERKSKVAKDAKDSKDEAKL